MKKTIITIMLALVWVTGWAQKYTIKADITPMIEEMAKYNVIIDTFYLADYGTKEPITKKYALKNNKINLKGKVEKPQLAALELEMRITGGVRTNHIPFILEAGNITITMDGRSCIVAGTPLNDALFSITREFGQARQDGESDKARQLIKDYILKHHDDLTAVLMLTALDYSTVNAAKEALALVGECSEEVQQHPTTVQFVERLNIQINRPKEGNKFKDFAVEYDGKTTRFSDYVGKGQYVLVDFWASWCGPCRAEIPNLIAAYNKYKEKGLVVLGVAVSDKPEATLKAIEDEKIPYPQIINSQQIATSLYGIRGIPEIMLFGPDGTIVKQGLRGENIEKTLAEIYKE